MGGGAWPFLVGGVICLVNSVNERDLNLLNSRAHPWPSKARTCLFLRPARGWFLFCTRKCAGRAAMARVHVRVVGWAFCAS